MGRKKIKRQKKIAKKRKKQNETKKRKMPAKIKAQPKFKPKHEILYKNIDWATETAAYFGFSPHLVPEITKEDREKAKETEKGEHDIGDVSLPFLNLTERISILRDYTEKKWEKEPQPVLVAYTSKKQAAKSFNFGLEIIGSPKSIADATIIKTAYEILRDRGFEQLSVSVNSMGDRESFGRFVREFVAHCRKNISGLHPTCRQEFKKNSLCLLSCNHEKCAKVLENSPKPINSLSELCRAHFKEVLEHIEMLGIQYKIEDTLVANRIFGCQTIFKISEEKNGKVLAAGARYNILARKIGFKKELPAVGARLEIRDMENKISTSRKIEKPLVCFVQIGFEAKLKSLQIIEMLREAKIPTYQLLSRDKLSSQLQIAENLKIPFTLIMGQKEAMENSVIVRSMANRSQETISLSELPKYLKKILG